VDRERGPSANPPWRDAGVDVQPVAFQLLSEAQGPLDLHGLDEAGEALYGVLVAAEDLLDGARVAPGALSPAACTRPADPCRSGNPFVIAVTLGQRRVDGGLLCALGASS